MNKGEKNQRMLYSFYT